MGILIIAMLLVGCGEKEDQPEVPTARVRVPPDARPPDAAARAVPTAPEPGKLAVCSRPMAEEPLAAICKLGTPAGEFPFNGCDKPPVLGWCKKTTMFACRSSSLPPVTYTVHVASVTPPPKSGETIDASRYKLAGPVKALEISLLERNEAAGQERANEITATLERWGCVVTDRGDHASADLDCGSWQAEVAYNEYIDKVLVDAAWRGWIECQ